MTAAFDAGDIDKCKRPNVTYGFKKEFLQFNPNVEVIVNLGHLQDDEQFGRICGVCIPQFLEVDSVVSMF